MANNKDFKVKNGIQPTAYHEGLGTVTSGSVTVGYDITSVTDTGSSFDVTSQATNPRAVTFKPDGTKMYVIDLGVDAVFQYSLSTAWDLSTVSYDSVSFSVASQETTPYSIIFNNDGTSFYISGNVNDRVYQYTCSTAYDLSTASYASKSFSVSSQDPVPFALLFNNDGAKMYVLGVSSGSLYQYSLSTAFDVSTASYDSKSLNLSSQDTSPYAVSFNDDGTKLFVIGAVNNMLYQYSLTTAYDISTASYDNISGDMPEAGSWYGFYFSPSGESFFTMANIVLAFDVTEYSSTSTTTTATLDLSTGSVFEITPTSDIQINLSNPAASGTVSQATLLLDGAATNTYDLANASYDGVSFSVAAQDGSPRGLFFKADGTKMYVLGDAGDSVFQYTLSTSWDVSTSSYDSVSLSVSAQDNSPRDLYISPDGTKMYIAGGTGDEVNEYSLSTAWDISTASYVQVFSVSAQDTAPEGIFFKPDGTKMYILGEAGDDVNEYTLSTSWDVSTASYTQNFTISTQSTIPGSLSFSSDGFTMYILSAYLNDGVYAYNLSTAWDISTATYSGVFFDVSAQETSPTALYIKTDGNNLYLTGTSTAKVYQYSTASVSTITYPTNITWPGGTAPTSPAIGETDVLTFSTRDGGTTYQAAIAIDGAA